MTVTARATAEAIAEAIADANIWCETHGADTLACGMTQASIEEVAYAQVSTPAARSRRLRPPACMHSCKHPETVVMAPDNPAVCSDVDDRCMHA